jgi:hypothetical protein
MKAITIYQLVDFCKSINTNIYRHDNIITLEIVGLREYLK